MSGLGRGEIAPHDVGEGVVGQGSGRDARGFAPLLHGARVDRGHPKSITRRASDPVGGLCDNPPLSGQTDATLPAGATVEPIRDVSRRGTLVARYVVLREVGRGGMGRVFAAYDPKLDRTIALKVLRDTRAGPEALARLLREAQSLARLNHPNVVTVHDVGEHEEQVFVAMEFVEGQTLTAWQAERTRSWREVVQMFRQAALGLAAAHEAGVVHRDFKPDNVMVEPPRTSMAPRVRVMDFGLAFSAKARSEDAPEAGDELDGLTRPGAMMGTPAYMSPEQFRNQSIGPASDQFSFCIALYEALEGERPFAAGSLEELSVNVTTGRARTPRAGVPAWLRGVVQRGLSTEPQDRFESMHHLIAALDGGARRRQMLFGAGLVGAALVAGIASWQQGPDDSECRDAQRSVRSIWTAERQASLGGGLEATGHRLAATNWSRASAAIDAFAEDWIRTHDQVCTTWRATLPPDLLEARRTCLLVQRAHLGGLLDAFETPTATTVGFAVAAAAGLPRPEDCAELDSAADLPPPDWRDRVLDAQRLLARARAQYALGDRTGARTSADGALEAAQGVRAPRTRAPLLAFSASMHFRSGDRERGAAQHAEALQLAAQSGDAPLESRLWLDRALYLDAHHGASFERREENLEGVTLAVARAGHRAEDMARLSSARGGLALDRDRYDEAAEHFTDAIARAAEADLPPILRARFHDLLGQARSAQGDYAAAEAEMRRALAVIEDAFGPAHPAARDHLANIGVACTLAGKRDCAREQFEVVAERLDAAGEGATPSRAENLSQRASLAYAEGDLGGARELAEAAVEIWTDLERLDSLRATVARSTLARVARQQERYDDALTGVRELLEFHRTRFGDDHDLTLSALADVGGVLEAMGRFAEADEVFAQALAGEKALHDGDHEHLALASLRWARVRHARGDADSNVKLVRDAHEMVERLRSRPELRGDAAFLLARLVEDSDEATALARRASNAYVDAGRGSEAARREVDAWLNARASSAGLAARD